MSDLVRSGGGSRGGDGRGSTSLRSSFRETGSLRVSLASAAKIHRAADVTRSRSEQHYEKHRKAWVAKAYTKLLLKDAPTLTLKPFGVETDRKAQLYSQAGREVAHRQTQRVARIQKAKTAILNGGKVRSSRTIDWSVGLGG